MQLTLLIRILQNLGKGMTSSLKNIYKIYSYKLITYVLFLMLNGLPFLSFAHPDTSDTLCPTWTPPLPFGGAANAEVNLGMAERWLSFRALREELRMMEALEPQKIQARFRIERSWIQQGCVSISQLIDLGRALFLRRWTREEGYGGPYEIGVHQFERPTKFQRGLYGGPDAGACIDCHWKGGFAGGGDRVDNVYAFGDGETLDLHEARNPLALWGSGWVELIAHEMTQELQQQRAQGIQQAKQERKQIQIELKSKGTEFGTLTILPTGEVQSQLEGIDPDLTIKPFGWRGVFKNLRDFVEVSAHKHFTLQSEGLLRTPPPEVLLNLELQGPPDPQDLDQDGVRRELTDGQIDALVAFLATLDAPIFEVPTEIQIREPFFVGEAKVVPAPELTLKWQEGARLFDQLGCAGCHTPMMPLKSSEYILFAQDHKTPRFTIDLAQYGAKPYPEKNEKGIYWVPVFSDFKRHHMGDRLKGIKTERGVPATDYFTRRLWGVAQTSPYLHTGNAITLEEVVYQHGGAGSEAEFAAESYFELKEGQRASVRLFIKSLGRAPTIRVR